MKDRYALPTVKQHLSAIQGLLDHLVVGYVLPANPAAPVRGPKHVVKQGKRWWLRLHEKDGRFHRVPAHHNAEAYLEVAGIWNEKGTPLWRSMTRDGTFIRTPGTALPRYTERCHEGAQLAAGLQREAADRKTATTTIVIRNMRATWAPKPTRDHTTSRPRPA